jgi:peptidyl-prolyl isomerase D
LKEGEEWKGADVVKIADELKGMGNKAFKSGDLKLGLSKYQKAVRYLQEYPAPNEGDPAELGSQLQKLRISLHTNSALLQYKLKQYDDATRSADYALAIESITDAEKAKALFRKGVVAKEQKNEEDATKFLEEAGKLAPSDAGIKNELAAVKKSATDRKAKERKAYSKMFE